MGLRIWIGAGDRVLACLHCNKRIDPTCGLTHYSSLSGGCASIRHSRGRALRRWRRHRRSNRPGNSQVERTARLAQTLWKAHPPWRVPPKGKMLLSQAV